MARHASSDLAEVWRDRILAHKQSGKSVERFCLENGLKSHRFYWWRRRLAKDSPATVNVQVKATTAKPARALVPVHPVQKRANAPFSLLGADAMLSITFDSGVCIQAPASELALAIDQILYHQARGLSC
jgi:hypothetical protein